MGEVLVDTDVFSYLFKGDTRAALYWPHVAGKVLHLSFATVAELYRWTLHANWGQPRIDDLNDALRSYTIVPYDDAMAWEWARVMTIKGRPIAPGDAWIAATAVRLRIPLITHNRKHFEHVPNLTLISE